MQWINGLLLLATALFFIFVSAYFTAFYPTKMVYSPFFSFAEKQYTYDEITTLAKVDYFYFPENWKMFMQGVL